MKKDAILFFIILLFHLVVINPTDYLLLNFEFLAQGSVFNESNGKTEFILYNYLLSMGMIIIFVSMIFKSISQTLNLKDYIITRCGHLKFKMIVIKVALTAIFKILAIKQIIYILFFIKTQSFTLFYFYDMISTFLTLIMFSLVFIVLKLQGVKDKILLFGVIFLHMISQILSYNNIIFSIIVIASINWEAIYAYILIAKIVVIVTSIFILLSLKNLDKTIGVKE